MNLHKIYFSLIACIVSCICIQVNAQSYNTNDIVQVTGVVLTADSQYTLPYESVDVKNKKRGDYTSDNGVFSIACIKGDTLVFSTLGYKTKQFIVPKSIEGKFYSMTQLMAIDTFFLEETVIKGYMPQNAEEFEYALRHWEMTRDMYATPADNTNPYVMQLLKNTLPSSGAETQSRTMQNEAFRATYGPQIAPQNLGNPFKWKEFFDAFKRGDFKTIKKK